MPSPWKTGCVIFDDPVLRSGGWASFTDENGSPSEPFRINGTGQLGSDVVWWLNIDYTNMGVSGLRKHPRFRGDYYLRTRMDQIFAEWGASSFSPADKTVLGAILFWRVMEFARIHYRFDRIPLDSLRSGIREVWPNDEVLDPKIREAMLNSLTEYTHCERTEVALENSGKNISFVLPRYRHAASILDSPVPDNDWKIVPSSQVPKNCVIDANFRKWMTDFGKPVLVQAVVSEINPEVNGLLNFGSGVRKHKVRDRENAPSARRFWDPDRSWMTVDEAIVLSRFATVSVSEVIASGRLVRLSDYQNAWPQETGNPEFLSWSYGLFMENVWTARTSILPGERETSGWQIFYRSLDHVLCLQAAHVLREKGLVIMGYGTGRVSARIPNGMTDAEMADAALAAGVVPESLDPSMTQFGSHTKSIMAFLIRGAADMDRKRFHQADLKCLEKHSGLKAGNQPVAS
ncbi:hypothetical protein [Leptospirillum ferriphilum]|uniref:hypothetical protein n=1 Tax=Leptospirillum ferriphilum TaxID=178606 RepID=UPI0006B1AAE4|nr:hypothetical protein [Leptospirillum ferriphilum]